MIFNRGVFETFFFFLFLPFFFLIFTVPGAAYFKIIKHGPRVQLFSLQNKRGTGQPADVRRTIRVTRVNGSLKTENVNPCTSAHLFSVFFLKKKRYPHFLLIFSLQYGVIFFFPVEKTMFTREIFIFIRIPNSRMRENI